MNRSLMIVAVLIGLMACVSGARAVVIETVPVGNPGNAADTEIMGANLTQITRDSCLDPRVGRPRRRLSPALRADAGCVRGQNGEPASFEPDRSAQGSAPPFRHAPHRSSASRPSSR